MGYNYSSTRKQFGNEDYILKKNLEFANIFQSGSPKMT